ARGGLELDAGLTPARTGRGGDDRSRLRRDEVRDEGRPGRVHLVGERHLAVGPDGPVRRGAADEGEQEGREGRPGDAEHPHGTLSFPSLYWASCEGNFLRFRG